MDRCTTKPSAPLPSQQPQQQHTLDPRRRLPSEASQAGSWADGIPLNGVFEGQAGTISDQKGRIGSHNLASTAGAAFKPNSILLSMMINFIQVRLDESLKRLESRSRVRQSKLDTLKAQVEEMTGIAKDYLTEQVEIERRAAASKGTRGKSPINKGTGTKDTGAGQESSQPSKSSLLEELLSLQTQLQFTKPSRLEICSFPPACEMPADPIDQPSPAPLGFGKDSAWDQDGQGEKTNVFEQAAPAVLTPVPAKKVTRTVAIQTVEPEVKYQQTRKTVASYLESRYAQGGCCVQCRNCREVIDLVRYAELEAAESAKRNEKRQKESFLRLSTPKKQKIEIDVSAGNKENEVLANTSMLSEQKSTNSTNAKSAAQGGQEKSKEIERRRLELLLILDEVGTN